MAIASMSSRLSVWLVPVKHVMSPTIVAVPSGHHSVSILRPVRSVLPVAITMIALVMPINVLVAAVKSVSSDPIVAARATRRFVHRAPTETSAWAAGETTIVSYLAKVSV